MAAGRAIGEARAARRRAGGRATRALGAAGAAIAFAGVALWATMIRMPGASFTGPLAPLTEAERAVEAGLRRDVQALAGEIGDRSVQRHEGLVAAAAYLERSFASAGYPVARQTYEVEGKACDNVEAERRGGARANEIVVIGAHYDSVAGTVGADDNASGVAALLALARSFASEKPARTLRFVAFANEEPPWFQHYEMGSLVYAKRSRARGERIVAMLSLETLGYYTDRPGTQHYPAPFGLFYPTTGDFIGFVGDTSSRDLVRRVVSTFRASTAFPSEGVAAPGAIPGIGWSDHWSFWQQGYPAVMVTDTAPFRYPHYHERRDTPGELSYAPMARVVVGIARVVEDLANR
jgi:Zn-dependent M28 family amino/carboxypeptidase